VCGDGLVNGRGLSRVRRVSWCKPGLPWRPTEFVFRSKDREDDYGEEVKGEEEVREEESGPGTQEEKDDKEGREEINQEVREEGGAEESRAEAGRAEAQGSGKKAGPSGSCA
jgi:hypothetical protein